MSELRDETREAIRRFHQESPPVDGFPTGGLGESKCGCYADSGPYEIHCKDHDPYDLIDRLLDELSRLTGEDLVGGPKGD